MTGDILDFHAELTHLLDRYSQAGCCPGCISEALVKAAVGMVVTTGGICWSAGYPEEVEMIGELARRVVQAERAAQLQHHQAAVQAANEAATATQAEPAVQV